MTLNSRDHLPCDMITASASSGSSKTGKSRHSSTIRPTAVGADGQAPGTPRRARQHCIVLRRFVCPCVVPGTPTLLRSTTLLWRPRGLRWSV